MDIIRTLSYQLHFQVFLSVFFLIKWILYHQTKDKSKNFKKGRLVKI